MALAVAVNIGDAGTVCATITARIISSRKKTKKLLGDAGFDPGKEIIVSAQGISQTDDRNINLL